MYHLEKVCFERSNNCTPSLWIIPCTMAEGNRCNVICSRCHELCSRLYYHLLYSRFFLFQFNFIGREKKQTTAFVVQYYSNFSLILLSFKTRVQNPNRKIAPFYTAYNFFQLNINYIIIKVICIFCLFILTYIAMVDRLARPL